MTFLDFVFKTKIFFIFFPMKNNLAVHMRYHLFLHYGWFLQNLGKDFIPSNMHTTVHKSLFNKANEFKKLSSA